MAPVVVKDFFHQHKFGGYILKILMVDDHNSHAKFMVGVQNSWGKSCLHGCLIFYGKLVGKWEEEKLETLINVNPATRRLRTIP